MHIVYLLRSKRNRNRVYVGLCGHMKNRLAEHNSGECKTTSNYRPWEVDVAVCFREEEKAHACKFWKLPTSDSGNYRPPDSGKD
jgi:predicted GIY-YIG superfamily endonuclease